MSDDIRPLRREIELQVRDRIDAAQRYLCQSPGGGFAVYAPATTQIGESVVLRVEIKSTGASQEMLGKVAWCRILENPDRVLAGVVLLSSESAKPAKLFEPLALEQLSSDFPRPRIRQEDRFDANLTISFRADRGVLIRRTRDISRHGLAVHSREAPRSKEIRFQVHPADEDDSIELRGRIAWRQPSHLFGIEILDPDPCQRKRFDQILHKLDPS